LHPSTPPIPFPILYQDGDLVAINKPDGILVHRSPISRDEVFVLQRLRDQIRQRVYPVHRLDRPTSGALLFGLNREATRGLAGQFESGSVDKRYLAVVRGYTEDAGVIDHPLSHEERPQARDAVTRYRRLATVELDIPVGRYPTSRYSLVEVQPGTGRMHQIRRHFKHIFHPLIGDTTYGEGRHNRMFRERFGVERLLLHASRVELHHPVTDIEMKFEAPLPEDMQGLFARLGWQDDLTD